MDDKRFYEFQQRIPNQTNVNALGYITKDGIPFSHSGSAVRYAMKKFPEAEPGWHTVVYDPEKCKDAARMLIPEYARMIDDLDAEIENQRKKIDSMVAQINKLNDCDLVESVHKKVLTDDLYREQGIFTGLIRANQMLRTRKIELIQCSSLKVNTA